MAVGDLVDREERPAYVKFERRAIEDKAESLKQGKSVSKDVDFVLVTPPYSKDRFEFKVESWFKNQEQQVSNGRTPAAYLDYWKKSYQNWKNGQDAPVNGTSIKDWSAISPAQIKNLLAINILTIEDLACANDEGRRRIGMGANDLINKAKAYLQATKDHGPLVMEVSDLKSQNEQLKGTIETLQNQIQRLTMQIQNVSSERLNLVRPDAEITVEDILEEGKEKTELELLREEYKATFGKEPHHLMRERGLKEKLGLLYGKKP